MTVPGGVISLPPGASTLETLEANLQNMSAPAMKARAVDRFPSIMDGSTGGSPAVDLTPFGILTSIWAGTNSLVANADPADIEGPEDLPGLLLDFIEGLPVIGQLVGLVEAILGSYDGNDQVLLTIQNIFAPIRKLMQMITGVFDGFPSVAQVVSGFPNFIRQPLVDLVDILTTVLDSIPIIGPPVGNALEDLAAMFGLLKTKADTAQATGEAAQTAADNANIGVAQLKGQAAASEVPDGVYFTDSFDRIDTTGLGPKYILASSGVPTGPLRTDGNNAWWNVGGNGQGTRFALIDVPLHTIYQSLQVILDTKLANMSVADPRARIVLRSNFARTSYVYAEITWNSIRVFKVISGTTTALGPAVALPNPSADGDLWTFIAGTDDPLGGDDEFRVYQNNAEALRVKDSGTLAGKGTGYEYTAFVLVNGQIQVGFGTVVQDPPRVQGITGNDRLPNRFPNAA